RRLRHDGDGRRGRGGPARHLRHPARGPSAAAALPRDRADVRGIIWPMTERGEVERLEALWRGDFGDEYVERNRAAAQHRDEFWTWIHGAHPFASVLELGCNLGGNLHWLAQLLDPAQVYGVDINAQALREVRKTLPDVNVVRSPARSLPFRDAMFDLTFTTT